MITPNAKAQAILDRICYATLATVSNDGQPWNSPYWKLAEVCGNAPVRLYKAIPQKIWTNGDGQKDGQYIDVRVEAEA